MMGRWNVRLSCGPKKDVGEVRLANGIIQGDAFSPLLFVLMIDPLIKVVKKRVNVKGKVLCNIEDLKASMTGVDIAQEVHEAVKKFAASVEIAINSKKSAIQLNVETLLPEFLQDIPRHDETMYKYIRFEMKEGDFNSHGMMRIWEKKIKERLKSRPEESPSLRRKTGSTSSTRTSQVLSDSTVLPSSSHSGGLTGSTR